MSPTFVESRGRSFNIKPDKYEKYVLATLHQRQRHHAQSTWLTTAPLDINLAPPAPLSSETEAYSFESAALSRFSSSSWASSSHPSARPPSFPPA